LRQFSKGKDVWLDGRVLRVPGKLGTAIKIKRHRAIEGTPKTLFERPPRFQRPGERKTMSWARTEPFLLCC